MSFKEKYKIAPSLRQKPLFMVLYGENGIGKTTFAAGFPGAVLLPCEDGAHSVPGLQSFPIAQSYEELIAIMDELAITKDSGIKTLIIDGAEIAAELQFNYILKKLGIKSPEEAPYGGFYTALAQEGFIFAGRATKLNKNGIAFVILGHTKVRRVESPLHAPYDQVSFRANDRFMAPLIDAADIVGLGKFNLQVRERTGQFGAKESYAVSDNKRLLIVEPDPSHLAKTRFPLKNMALDTKTFLSNYRAALQKIHHAPPAEVPATEVPAVEVNTN